MIIKKRTFYSALFVGLVGCFSASAQHDCADSIALPSRWTYEQCVDYARNHNIKMQQSLLTKQAGSYDLEAAKAQWFPTLSFSTSQNYTNYPSTGNTGSKNNIYTGTYGLNAGWNLFDGGNRSNTIKRNEVQSKINDLSVEEMDDNLRVQILQYYLQILYAMESIEIAEKNLEVSKSEMQRAEQLMNSGRLSRVDYVQLQSQYQNDLYNVTSAKTNLASQKSSLKQLLELSIGYDIELVDVDFSEEQVLRQLPDKSEVYYKAINWMPSLKSSRLQEEMSDYDINIAKSGSKPKVSINAGVGTNNGSGTGLSLGDQLRYGLHENVGLSLSVPIIDQKSTKTNVAKAKIAKLNAELDSHQLLHDISQNVESCYLEAVNAQAKYISGKESLKSAELTDELTIEKFNIGKVNTLELLSSHASLANARQELLQLKYLAILNQKLLDYYENKELVLP